MRLPFMTTQEVAGILGLRSARRMYRSLVTPRRKILLRDALNLGIFGSPWPMKYMLLYVRPSDVNHIADEAGFSVFRKSTPNVVMAGAWDVNAIEWEQAQRNEDYLILQGVGQHVNGGVSWAGTDLYARLERMIDQHGGPVDGCKNLADIEERYRGLDDVIEFARRNRCLKSQSAVSGGFRESGGIDVSVARNGEILKSGGGGHRLAIAKSLNLPAIPVCLNAVHPLALSTGSWQAVVQSSIQLQRLQETQAQSWSSPLSGVQAVNCTEAK